MLTWGDVLSFTFYWSGVWCFSYNYLVASWRAAVTPTWLWVFGWAFAAFIMVSLTTLIILDDDFIAYLFQCGICAVIVAAYSLALYYIRLAIKQQ